MFERSQSETLITEWSILMLAICPSYFLSVDIGDAFREEIARSVLLPTHTCCDPAGVMRTKREMCVAPWRDSSWALTHIHLHSSKHDLRSSGYCPNKRSRASLASRCRLGST